MLSTRPATAANAVPPLGTRPLVAVGVPVNAVPTTPTVSTIGTYKSYLGSAFPPGTYTVTVTWSGGAVSTSGAKIASVDLLSAEPPPALFELAEEPPAWP